MLRNQLLHMLGDNNPSVFSPIYPRREHTWERSGENDWVLKHKFCFPKTTVKIVDVNPTSSQKKKYKVHIYETHEKNIVWKSKMMSLPTAKKHGFMARNWVHVLKQVLGDKLPPFPYRVGETVLILNDKNHSEKRGHIGWVASCDAFTHVSVVLHGERFERSFSPNEIVSLEPTRVDILEMGKSEIVFTGDYVQASHYLLKASLTGDISRLWADAVHYRYDIAHYAYTANEYLSVAKWSYPVGQRVRVRSTCQAIIQNGQIPLAGLSGTVTGFDAGDFVSVSFDGLEHEIPMALGEIIPEHLAD